MAPRYHEIFIETGAMRSSPAHAPHAPGRCRLKRSSTEWACRSGDGEDMDLRLTQLVEGDVDAVQRLLESDRWLHRTGDGLSAQALGRGKPADRPTRKGGDRGQDCLWQLVGRAADCGHRPVIALAGLRHRPYRTAVGRRPAAERGPGPADADGPRRPREDVALATKVADRGRALQRPSPWILGADGLHAHQSGPSPRHRQLESESVILTRPVSKPRQFH